jgi:uncharacterized membrane protein
MKEAQVNNQEKSQYLGKDLLKSFLLSIVAIAIVAALYYVWK